MKKMLLGGFLSVCGGLFGVAYGQGVITPRFEERALAAGIDQKYTGPFEYFVGGGAASLDCDGDGLHDVFIAGGTSAAKLYRNNSTPAGPIQFSQQLLPVRSALLEQVVGAYPLDFNNDRLADLVLLRHGENVLLRNKGDCQFEIAQGFDGGDAWTTSFAAIWEANQPYPTLAFGNYIDQSLEGAPFRTCHDNRLVRADDRGRFNSSVNLSPGYCALSILFTDWNNNGRFDLRVSNDRQYHVDGEEQLWQIRGTDTRPRLFTRDDGWKELVIWGMGIAEGDINSDGFPEYALTSMADTKLQQIMLADIGPIYEDIAFALNATAHRPYVGDNSRASTGWHSQFADINNDTRTDLYIAKGNVERMPDFAQFDPDNLLLGTADGPFIERGFEAGIAMETRGRGAVIEDFNNDGALDLLVVNREEPVTLFQAEGPAGGFLRVQLDQPDFNRFGVGAKVKVVALEEGKEPIEMLQTLRIGGGHASGQLGPLHFGLGSASHAVIYVTWPDGSVSNGEFVRANHSITISRRD